MPAFTLNPNATGNYSEWSNNGGASALASVSDTTDGNYIYNPNDNTGRKHSFEMEDLPADAVSISGSVVLNSRNGRSGSTDPGTGQVFFRQASTDAFEPVAGFGFPVSWTDRQDTYATAPDSGAWTVAKVNATEIGIYSWGAGPTDEVYCTKLFATGNYIPQAGGFAFLIGSTIGPLLGAGILLSHMQGIALAVWRAKKDGLARVLIRPDEYLEAWRELRAHPFRRSA